MKIYQQGKSMILHVINVKFKLKNLKNIKRIIYSNNIFEIPLEL